VDQRRAARPRHPGRRRPRGGRARTRRPGGDRDGDHPGRRRALPGVLAGRPRRDPGPVPAPPAGAAPRPRRQRRPVRGHLTRVRRQRAPGRRGARGDGRPRRRPRRDDPARRRRRRRPGAHHRPRRRRPRRPALHRWHDRAGEGRRADPHQPVARGPGRVRGDRRRPARPDARTAAARPRVRPARERDRRPRPRTGARGAPALVRPDRLLPAHRRAPARAGHRGPDDAAPAADAAPRGLRPVVAPADRVRVGAAATRRPTRLRGTGPVGHDLRGVRADRDRRCGHREPPHAPESRHRRPGPAGDRAARRRGGRCGPRAR
jgi:hypothetical protein